ncbi:MAG: 1-acyl-sn-glycerol-3-phosphate acyltransferase [Actinobacteria bacterium]|nr:1-acyl-sn-glycerol-3-phosphate acyltransferase [Actinomycetota bacterium]
MERAGPAVGWRGARPGRAEPVYAAATAAALTAFRAFSWDVRVTGEHHIPTRGPAILAANHVGYLDFVFLGLAARPRGRRVRFMALKEAFDHRLGGPLLRAMRHIPVDRRGDPAAALREAIRALERGEVVGIHPEARLNGSLVPGSAKTGAARMAMATGAPILPAVVWGSQRILPRGRRPRLPRGVAVDVRVGSPIAWEPGDDLAGLTERMMGRIRDLYDTSVREYPQQPRDADDRWWLPAHLGGTAPATDAPEPVTGAPRRPGYAGPPSQLNPNPST